MKGNGKGALFLRNPLGLAVYFPLDHDIVYEPADAGSRYEGTLLEGTYERKTVQPLGF